MNGANVENPRPFFSENGFTLICNALTTVECEAIDMRVHTIEAASGSTRCLLSQDWCAALAKKLHQHSVISMLVPSEFVAVQCTYFEKSAAHNWLVPIHQDLSIPVAERISDTAFRGWSEKEGVLFVQPPVEILEQIIIIRLHLDPCSLTDGPLRVVPGSHMRGRITPEAALIEKSSSGEVTCVAGPGDVLAMRPLLLHASSKSSGTNRRRVLHFIFGPRTLTHGLRWPTSVLNTRLGV